MNLKALANSHMQASNTLNMLTLWIKFRSDVFSRKMFCYPFILFSPWLSFIGNIWCESLPCIIRLLYHWSQTETLQSLSQADTPPLSLLTYLDYISLFELPWRTLCPYCQCAANSDLSGHTQLTCVCCIDRDRSSRYRPSRNIVSWIWNSSGWHCWDFEEASQPP